MKRTSSAALLLALLLVLVGTVAADSGGQVVVKLKDGTTHVFDMSEVEYIQYFPEASVPMVSPFKEPGSTYSMIAGVKLPFTAGAMTFADELDGGLGTKWAALSAVGGDFGRFAKFAGGDLIIDVPSGNSWGNTGIMSKGPLFTLTAAEKVSPYTIFIKINAVSTTSFVAALASIADPDVWGRQNAWFTYTPALNRQESLYTAYGLLNTQSAEKYGTDAALGIKDEGAPAWVAFRVYVGRVELYLSGQDKPFELKLSWLKEGTPVYLHLFTALRRQGDPAKLSVDGIFLAK